LPESGRGLVRWALRRPAVPAWIQPGFAKRIELTERIGRGRILPPGRSLSQSDLYRQVTNGFLVQVEETDERQAARCGLELRHPFHDRRVVEFGLQIPEDQRRRGLFTKFVLRNAMAGMLPESIRERRTKADFSHAFLQALQALGGETRLGVPTLDSLGWIDGARSRDLGRHIVDRSRDGTIAHTTSLWALWMVYGMELWINTVFPEQGKMRLHAEWNLATPHIS
jgi:asparagine synthase (glutamine-hydrolysing)